MNPGLAEVARSIGNEGMFFHREPPKDKGWSLRGRGTPSMVIVDGATGRQLEVLDGRTLISAASAGNLAETVTARALAHLRVEPDPTPAASGS